MCENIKPESEFYRDKSGLCGLRSQCKPCENARKQTYNENNREKQKAYSAQYREENKEYLRLYHAKPEVKQRKNANDKAPARKKTKDAYRLKHVYGITSEQYDAILKSQSHKCKICGADEVDVLHKKLCVDHCHKTGIVRGLLCNKCNVVLGMAGDRIDVLEAAIAYLRGIA